MLTPDCDGARSRQPTVNQNDLQTCLLPRLRRNNALMPPTARPIAAGLRELPGPAALLERWETAQAIGRVLAPVARSVAPGIDLLAPGRCDLRDGVLWIAVQSAAESAKLRQAAPRMLAALSVNGWQVYEMKTRVQAGATSYPGQGTDPPSSPEMGFAAASDRGIAAVELVARQLPESPLQRAIERLAVTLRRRSGVR